MIDSLSLPLLISLIGSIFILVLGGLRARTLSIISVILLVIPLISILYYTPQALSGQFVISSSLFGNQIPYLGSFSFYLSRLNIPFVYSILIITTLTSLYSIRYMEKRFEEIEREGGRGSWGVYYSMYNLFSSSMLSLVMSTNYIELFLFLELALLSSFLLIALYGYGNRRRISLMYFVWTHIGTLIFLSGVLLLDIFYGSVNIITLYGNTDIGIIPVYDSIPLAGLVSFLMIFGLLFKSAVFGFHIWLPYAHGEAPTPISVLLSPNLVGLGLYVITLIGNLSFPSIFSSNAYPLLFLALFTIIYGGMMALSQRDFKRFLAYSSISQMGYMLVGITTGALYSPHISPSQALYSLPLGTLASQFVYVSHAIGKSILFMIAGNFISYSGERDIYKMGGIYSSSPLTSTLAFLGFLNLMGAPPTVGFWSDFLTILSVGQATFNEISIFIPGVIMLIIGIGITIGYTTNAFRLIFGGENKGFKFDERKARESLIYVAIIAFMGILFFIFPSTIVPTYLFSVLPESLGQIQLNGLSLMLILIPLLPMVGSAVSLLSSKKLNESIRGFISSLTIFLSAIFSTYLLISNESVKTSIPWITSLGIDFSLRINGLVSIIASLVSWVSFLIALYSIGYMKEDRVLRRYWAYFTFFVGSMLLTVVANNIALFMIGWEGTSLASYGLISYWLNDRKDQWVGIEERKVLGLELSSSPTKSGIRAFVFTKMGDVGLVSSFGVLLYLQAHYGLINIFSFSLDSILSSYKFLLLNPSALIVLIIGILGPLAKSAQLPFTHWLLTAMTGPTPVSALIHAATMVNLGVIFLLYFSPSIVSYSYLNPGITGSFFLIVAIITSLTAFYTATNALANNEIKLVLAYSTSSQIAYMMAVIASTAAVSSFLGVNGNYVVLNAGILAALIQLISHASYKAALFMNAGSVIHLTHSRFVGKVKNLLNVQKALFVIMLLAGLNLAALPPLLGYFGKESVIGTISYSLNFGNYSLPPLILLVVTSGLTSFYIMRLIGKTFLYNSGEELHEVGKGDLTMLLPPLIIVLFTLIAGTLQLINGSIVSILEKFAGVNVELIENSLPQLITLSLALVGVLVSISIYFIRRVDFSNSFRKGALKLIDDFLYSGWGLNAILDYAGSSFGFLANNAYKVIDLSFFDGVINNGFPYFSRKFGAIIRRVQTGLLRDYLTIYIIGLIILIGFIALMSVLL